MDVFEVEKSEESIPQKLSHQSTISVIDSIVETEEPKDSPTGLPPLTLEAQDTITKFSPRTSGKRTESEVPSHFFHRLGGREIWQT